MSTAEAVKQQIRPGKLFINGRLAVYYSYQTDLGDGWEDFEVHKDPPEKHEAALRMGVNLFTYAVTALR